MRPLTSGARPCRLNWRSVDLASISTVPGSGSARWGWRPAGTAVPGVWSPIWRQHCLRTPRNPCRPRLVRAVAHLGAMHSVLMETADAIDRDPLDRSSRAKARAQITRFAVDHGATRILELTAAAAGARPLCHDRGQAQRAADLYVYLSQHHGLQEMVELGRQALRGARCP